MFPFDAHGRTSPLAATILLRLFGLFKIPMVFHLRPSILVWTEQRCVLRLRLNRRSKNQLGSMYFAALAAGADLAAGFFSIAAIRASGKPVSMVFKNVSADFLKRADGDVHFICDDGELIAALVNKTLATGQREEAPVHVVATVPDKHGEEPVATFAMTLSVKKVAKVAKVAKSSQTPQAKKVG